MRPDAAIAHQQRVLVFHGVSETGWQQGIALPHRRAKYSGPQPLHSEVQALGSDPSWVAQLRHCAEACAY